MNRAPRIGRTLLSSLLLVLAALSSPVARAVDADDESALQLADIAPQPVAQASDWRSFVEGAAGQSTPRVGPASGVQRLSLDTRYDGVLAPGWRAVLADRLDLDWPPQIAGQNAINTVKEAYLSRQAGSSTVLDLGRINVRNGVASGYNPTDYFKVGALRSVVSVDPLSLKENRQGSVMLRGQQLWTGGSLTALYSPRLANTPDNGGYGLDVGATNGQGRTLFALSQQIVEGVSPQLLLFKQDAQSPQLGFNLASLLGDATVLNLEWSGGRMASQAVQALRQQGLPYVDDSGWRNRLSAGLTYTTENKISLTAEYNYDGAALGQGRWNQLRGGPLPLYGVYENWVQNAQELPTQRGAFLYLNWQDALIPRLDLSAMQRYDLLDASRMQWLEARYHTLQRTEFAIQWQRNAGGNLSDYGVLPVRQSLLLVLRHFF